jgi:D-amino-acid dehydrogenase
VSVVERGPRPLPRGSSVAVIGAGIIGTSAAYALCERGYKVTLYDRAQPGLSGPSWGNAGHVVGSGIFPLGEPGPHGSGASGNRAGARPMSAAWRH